MLQTRAYSNLLETLYASSIDEAKWPLFLSQLCDITDSSAGFLLSNDSVLGSRTLAHGGGLPLRKPATEHYRRTSGYTDPIRQAFMRSPRVGVIEYDELLPHAAFAETDTYRLALEPLGLAHGTCVVPAVSPRSYEVISLLRGPDRLYLEPERKELLHLLLPHLKNVLKIRRAIGGTEARALQAEAMLDASATACLLLTETGHLLHMNRAAQALALAQDGFRVVRDRLEPTDASSRAQFKLLVALAANTADSPGDAIHLPRTADQRPLQLLVLPFRATEQLRSTARVLVLATDPDTPVAFPDAVLRRLYDMTPAETEIANGLLTGFSPEEIAVLRGVSVATTRSQLKSMMAKTSTRRQADLVRLLGSLPRASQPDPRS